jgi:hypothetical protein
LIRPYDLILIYGVLPLFVLAERAFTGEWSARKTALRLLPLLATAPVLGYCVALFQFHPVFKYWASQGDVKTIAIHWELFSFGLAGVLCLARLCLAQKHPLKSSAERLLAVWIAGVLFVMHGREIPGLGFMPYARVLGATLPSVMLLLGMPLLDPLARGFARPRAWGRIALLALLLLVNSLGSAVWLLKIAHNLAHLPDHYIGVSEHEAHVWLNQHARPSDVVLSTFASGNRMAKDVSCRFAVGHMSVTPNVKHLVVVIERFYRGEMTDDEASRLLDELNVRWIYFGPRERQLGTFDPARYRGITPRYAHGPVQVFSYEPDR